MATPHSTPPEMAAPEKPAAAGLPAEILFLLVIGCVTVFLSLAGIPGTPLPVAGDGSPALERGWAEQHAAEVARHDAPGGATPGR